MQFCGYHVFPHFKRNHSWSLLHALPQVPPIARFEKLVAFAGIQSVVINPQSCSPFFLTFDDWQIPHYDVK
jgi:hypothetical protein